MGIKAPRKVFSCMTDQFTIARARKKFAEIYGTQDIHKECAADFGRLLAHSEQIGLPREIAFVTAKDHFVKYGKAMQELGEVITYDLVNAASKKDSK
jgi:hypothetical protein